MITTIFNNEYRDAWAFVRVMDYIISADNEEKTLFTGCINMSCNKAQGQKFEMMLTAGLNTRCKNPLHHVVLSWAEGEVPTHDQYRQAALIYMDEMGLSNCRCFWGAHQNTENIHMHLCINRTDLLTLRTVNPANGWTRKTCEKVCRLIEVKQGWRSSPGKFWFADRNGNVLKKEGRPELQRSMPHGTGSSEHRYGVKSAITIAQEDASEALYSAGSWAELHERLSENNMQLEQQKGGLILHVGSDHVIKVSSVSHEVSLKKLEKRLGPYEPPLKTAELCPMRIAKVYCPVLTLWNYISLKLEYDAKKNEAFEDLKAKQGAELRKMKAGHKEAFKELYGVSWKGRKDELRREQKCLYASQRKERDKLSQDHINERIGFHREYPAFPEFSVWLKQDGRESIASTWAYRNSNVGILFNDSSVSDPIPRPIPVYGFEGRSFCEKGYWYVYYVNADGRAAFRDNGDSIEVFEKDWKSTSAALYLASRKWQRIGPMGPDWFMSIVAEIGASRDYPFSDKALVKRISLIRLRAKEQEAEARKTGLAQIDAFDRFHREVGAERYLVHVQHFSSAQKMSDPAYFICESLSGTIVGFTPSRFVADIPRLVTLQNDRGAYLKLVPQSNRYFYFMLVVPDVFKSSDFISRYPPLCAIYSSSSFGMLFYKLPLAYGVSSRIAAKRLIGKLCGELPPECLEGTNFLNFAPCFSVFPGKNQLYNITYEYGHLDINSALNRMYRDECKLAEEERISQISRRMETSAPVRAAENVFEAFRLHAADILREESAPNYCVIDRRIAQRLTITGYSYDEIVRAVEVCAPRAYPGERPEVIGWHDYAVRVVNSTKTTEGRIERCIEFPLKELYLRIEGRWTAEMEAAKVYDNEACGTYQGEVFSRVENGSFLLKLGSNGRLVRQYVTDSYLCVGDRIRISYGDDVTKSGTVERLPVRTVTPASVPETRRLQDPAVSMRNVPAAEVREVPPKPAVKTAVVVTPVAHTTETYRSQGPGASSHKTPVAEVREAPRRPAVKTAVVVTPVAHTTEMYRSQGLGASSHKTPAAEVREAPRKPAVKPTVVVTPAVSTPDTCPSQGPGVSTYQAPAEEVHEISKPAAKVAAATAEKQLPEEAACTPERPETEPDDCGPVWEDTDRCRRKSGTALQDSSSAGTVSCTQEQKVSPSQAEDVPVLFNVHSDDPENPYDRIYVEYIDRDRDVFGARDDKDRVSVHSMAGYRAKDTLAVDHCVSVKYHGNIRSGAGDIFDRTVYFEYSYAGMAGFVGAGVVRSKAEPGREYRGKTLRLDDKTVGICFVNGLGKNEIVEVSRESLARALGRDIRSLGDKESVCIMTGHPDARVVRASYVNERGMWIGY